jgi:hypothetical protein
MRWGWFQSHPTDLARVSKNGKLAVRGKFTKALPLREDEVHHSLKQVEWLVFGCMMVIEGDSVMNPATTMGGGGGFGG